MEIVSDIQESLDFPTISSNIFSNLTLEQVLVFCDSQDERKIKICNNPYVWKLYFEKNFTDEYNEYIQSLFEIYEESADFYYHRVEYLYLRNTFSLLANIKRIQRDGDDEIEGGLNRLDPNDMLTLGDVKNMLHKIMKDRDYQSFYDLINYKSGDPAVQEKIKDIFVNYLVYTLSLGSERELPIEFLELAYLKLGINDVIKRITALYGTGYYLDSIKNITLDKVSFRKNGTGYYLDSDKNITDDKASFREKVTKIFNYKGESVSKIASFVMLSHHFGKFKMEPVEGNRYKIIIYQQPGEDIDPEELFGNALIFYKLLLQYLGYTKSYIRGIHLTIKEFLNEIEIEVSERR